MSRIAILLALSALVVLTQAVEVQNLTGGDGTTFPKKGKMVTAHYTGKLDDGTVFDSSVRRNQPFQFTIGVGQVIKCWDDGMSQMSKGAKATLVCDPSEAYGERGAGGVIPPNARLTFDVELIDC